MGNGDSGDQKLWDAVHRLQEKGCNYRPLEEMGMQRLDRLEQNWGGLTGELAHLRTELVREVSAIRGDMMALSTELRESISANVNAFMKTLTWIAGAVLFAVLAYLSVQVYTHVTHQEPPKVSVGVGVR
jgi:hypothetical protein